METFVINVKHQMIWKPLLKKPLIKGVLLECLHNGKTPANKKGCL